MHPMTLFVAVRRLGTIVLGGALVACADPRARRERQRQQLRHRAGHPLRRGPAGDNGRGGLVAAPSRAPIINMSLGGSSSSQVLADAVLQASNAGSLIIAAAGNSGSAAPNYPAAYPQTVSVSAVGPSLLSLGRARRHRDAGLHQHRWPRPSQRLLRHRLARGKGIEQLSAVGRPAGHRRLHARPDRSRRRAGLLPHPGRPYDDGHFETGGWYGMCGFGSEVDTILDLYTAGGVLVGNADDIDFSSDRLCSRITTSLGPGTYYLRVRGFGKGRCTVRAW